MLWSLLVISLQAEPRFPPPDFESGHQIPELVHPAVRSLALQYLDVAVLLGALGLASWLTLRKRSRRGIVALSIFSLLYFGFYRAGCICAIGSIHNVTLALTDPGYALPMGVLVFFLAPLLTALFFGRSFCAAVCPHGALQDLVLVRPVAVPRWLEQGLGLLPFAFLGVGVLFAATGSTFLICRLDPFVPLFRMSGSFTMLAVGIGFLVVGLFIGRPYCRFLCPYGALLRLASMVSKWRVRVTPDTCTQCRLCEDACPYGVIRTPATVSLTPRDRGRERRRFVGQVVALPLLVAAGVWAGWQFGGTASQLDRRVDLAGLWLVQKSDSPRTNLTTVEQLALTRAEKTSAEMLPAAVEVRRDFRLGGAWLGAWIALVAGLRLLGFSFWRVRPDYEPDPGGCVGCGRCFRYCPQELLRLGLTPPAASAETVAAAPGAAREEPAPGR